METKASIDSLKVWRFVAVEGGCGADVDVDVEGVGAEGESAVIALLVWCIISAIFYVLLAARATEGGFESNI